jgi:Tol biopolymer transport system component
MMRVTFGGGNTHPVWSADGRYILFHAAEGMFWIRADGSGKPEPPSSSKTMQFPRSFAADGKRLAFTDINPATGSDVWTMPVESDSAGLRAGKPEVFLETPFNERMPALSPDGQWLAYASDESGTFQVYVRTFPDGRRKYQISNRDGFHPVWSSNRRELFFLQDGSSRLWLLRTKSREIRLCQTSRARGLKNGWRSLPRRGSMMWRRMVTTSSRSCRLMLRWKKNRPTTSFFYRVFSTSFGAA